MGAWDTTSFGNDTACDWLAELIDSGDSDMITDAFSAVLSADDDDLEAATAEEAVAAAEVLAWLLGRPGSSLDDSDGLEGWIEDQEVEEFEPIIKKGHKVIDRLTSGSSELYDVWEESGEGEDWKKALLDLKQRLKEA